MEESSDVRRVQVISSEKLNSCIKNLKKKSSCKRAQYQKECQNPCDIPRPQCLSCPTIKALPGQLYNIVAKLIAYLCEVVKLMASEPDTQVCDTLLDFYDGLTLLGHNLYGIVKEWCCKYYHCFKCYRKFSCKK